MNWQKCTWSIFWMILVLTLVGCTAPAAETPTETELPPASLPTSPSATRLPASPAPIQASPTPRSSEPTKETAADWHLVAIGDSSLWGLGEAFASQIEKDLKIEVAVSDFALPSLSAGSVLEALETGKSARYFRLGKLSTALEEAEVVVMFVNPVDSVDPEKPLELDGCFGCSTPSSCPPEAFDQYITDLKAIWANVYELRAGKPTILRATDLYNPIVGRWNDCDTYDACNACWVNLSNAVRQAAEESNVPFLSRYDAFNGADHREDPREKGYIRSDGEHPTDLACQFTAELLSKMGYEPVSAP